MFMFIHTSGRMQYHTRSFMLPSAWVVFVIAASGRRHHSHQLRPTCKHVPFSAWFMLCHMYLRRHNKTPWCVFINYVLLSFSSSRRRRRRWVGWLHPHPTALFWLSWAPPFGLALIHFVSRCVPSDRARMLVCFHSTCSVVSKSVEFWLSRGVDAKQFFVELYPSDSWLNIDFLEGY